MQERIIGLQERIIGLQERIIGLQERIDYQRIIEAQRRRYKQRADWMRSLNIKSFSQYIVLFFAMQMNQLKKNQLKKNQLKKIN